jgi:hypothetical protein
MRPSTGASLYGERPVKRGAQLTPNLAGFARRAVLRCRPNVDVL